MVLRLRADPCTRIVLPIAHHSTGRLYEMQVVHASGEPPPKDEGNRMKVFDFKQYSREYWDEKRGRPSASEFHRIITDKKWEFAKAGAPSYACELISQEYDFSYGNDEGFVTSAMRNGTITEPEARRYYEYETGLEVQQVGLCVSDCGRFCCSPDGLIANDGGLELKHPTAATHIKWLIAGTIPNEHLAQCYGSMIVTKRSWWDFLSYYPKLPPLHIRLVPDDKMLKLAEALDKFWKLLTEMRAKVESGEPSPLPGIKPQSSYF